VIITRTAAEIISGRDRGMRARALARAATLTGVLLLAGCSGYGTVYDKFFGDNLPPPACPEVWVLADGVALIKFRPGDGRDLTDVIFSGEILGVDATCAYERDRETLVGSVTVEVAVNVRAERGPADRKRHAALPYFVSLIDAERKLVQKHRFEIAVEFPGNLTRVRVRDDPPVTLTIPLKADQRGDLFQVYVGFQLTKDELEFSRKRRKRGR
jgi:hypothetical protein